MEKFTNWLKFSVRKLLISIKRNYFVIPLIFVAACCVQFMCNLYIISPAFARITGSGENDLKSYTAIFTFIVSLLTILSTVAYLNYALKKYGEKRPIIMVVIYLVMVVINIVLLFFIYNANYENLLQEVNKFNDPSTDEAAREICRKYIALGNQCVGIIITQIVLEVISAVLVITAPFVQNALKKLKFKAIKFKDEQEFGVKEDVKEGNEQVK